jgi:tetraacyldisaccharide 4'-kinase
MKPLPSMILLPLGAIYGAVTQARLKAYASGWLPVSKLPAPVISVGNLTTGGTGKTPLVEWVCRAINEGVSIPKKVGVLTRGYGRENPRSQVLVSDGAKVLVGEREAGDEPLLLARNLINQAAVVANRDRYAAGKWAIENLGSEVFVLDDGFQHLRLARDLDIAVIDATNPWGGEQLLPSGRLRETREGLRRADCVVITRTEQTEKLSELHEQIQACSGAKPIFFSRMRASRVVDLTGKEFDSKGSRSSTVAAFCGVGNPQSFFDQLGREGWKVRFTRAFPDHYRYAQSDIDRLVADAKSHGASALMTTAKDAIKLAPLKIELPCLVLEIQISIDDGDRLAEIIRAVA